MSDFLMTNPAESLRNLRAQIDHVCQQAQRATETVAVVAVSKTHSIEAIRQVLATGHRLFGENRVQEALQKFPILKQEFPDLQLHLIGPLQTNKGREAVAQFDVIQTLDRESLSVALAKEMKKQNRHLPCFVQINTGEEPQKAGILPHDADAFIVRNQTVHGLDIVGLMCIPPIEQDPMPHFTKLAEIAKRHKLAQLSMGMSGDFAVAIAAGATLVRVGTAIFGARPSFQYPV